MLRSLAYVYGCAVLFPIQELYVNGNNNISAAGKEAIKTAAAERAIECHV